MFLAAERAHSHLGVHAVRARCDEPGLSGAERSQVDHVVLARRTRGLSRRHGRWGPVMAPDDLIYGVFASLSQGAPGDNASTWRALDAIPDRDAVRQVLDLGAGYGRSTFALAAALPDAQLTSVDIHAPFVERMAERARKEGLAGRVRPLCADMGTLAIAKGSMDLIWAEGSIYLVGVERALALWRPWLRPGCCLVFSDFVRWAEDLSPECRSFWAGEYPDMTSEVGVRSLAAAAGYRTLASFRLSRAAHEAYYAPLDARLTELADRDDAGLAKLLQEFRIEIEMTRRYSDEAGYTFFVLQRPETE